jgi:hypothetical protein
MFGLPVAEARAAAADGQLALGGCVLFDPLPNWQCPSLHRWRDGEDEAWSERLRTVLVAYGYRD